jgi:hypothetical protein
MHLSGRDAALAATGGLVALIIGWGLGGIVRQHAPQVASSGSVPAASSRSPVDETSAVTPPHAATRSAMTKPTEADRVTVVGTAQVIDTVTLRVGDKVMRLYGTEWAKGSKPDDLASYIAGRPVRCEPADAKGYNCTIGAQDLSRVVLFNGGARATFDAPPALKDAELRRETQDAESGPTNAARAFKGAAGKWLRGAPGGGKVATAGAIT